MSPVARARFFSSSSSVLPPPPVRFLPGLTTGCRITVFHFYVGVRRINPSRFPTFEAESPAESQSKARGVPKVGTGYDNVEELASPIEASPRANSIGIDPSFYHVFLLAPVKYLAIILFRKYRLSRLLNHLTYGYYVLSSLNYGTTVKRRQLVFRSATLSSSAANVFMNETETDMRAALRIFWRNRGELTKASRTRAPTYRATP